MKPTVVRELSIRGLRNIHAVDLQPSAAVNVLYGDNGQGKTSLLEALYLVATTKSFRTHRVRDVVEHDAQGCHVTARIDDGIMVRVQAFGLAGTQQVVRIDGQKPANLAGYATRTPVVVFHPGELELTMGTASVRRTLLDRVALFQNPGSLAAHRAYTRALRERQTALEREGEASRSVDPWERLLAEHGAALTRARRQAADRIGQVCSEAFRAMAAEGSSVVVHYDPAGSEDPEVCAQRLRQDRSRDLRRPTARFGPHRDDLSILLGGRPARVVASQGQHRLITLSLKVAELTCLSEAAGSRAVLLLDDVSSELDAARASSFFALLGNRLDQVFLTTARREVASNIESVLGSAAMYEVIAGQVYPRTGSAQGTT